MFTLHSSPFLFKSHNHVTMIFPHECGRKIIQTHNSAGNVTVNVVDVHSTWIWSKKQSRPTILQEIAILNVKDVHSIWIWSENNPDLYVFSSGWILYRLILMQRTVYYQTCKCILRECCMIVCGVCKCSCMCELNFFLLNKVISCSSFLFLFRV
jgi:hypothetical protein